MNSTAISATQAPSLASTVSAEQKAKMEAKAKEFEQFFVYQFISLMSPEPDPDNVLGGGAGEKLFTKNLQEELAKSITNSGGFGIAKNIYAELLKSQEAGALTPSSATAQALTQALQ
jgi:peptidoglycan hydrolase FlgJ